MRTATTHHSEALNAICPYFTMFPLSFPLRVLRKAERGDWVLDPYCGRGTTNFAARLLGLPTMGIDGSPVAAALARAKLAVATVAEVLATARHLLGRSEATDRPRSEFWQRAFHRDTLTQLCRLRAGLLADCSTDAKVLLRAILLGSLHGPRTVNDPSYFSNQCTRTFAPKPAYSIRFWKKHKLAPRQVDALKLIAKRANRYLDGLPSRVRGRVVLGDSRKATLFKGPRRFKWVITSPPYYGMRTYIPDQWLRNWFMGGPSDVAYTYEDQLQHSSPRRFIEQLAQVWTNVARVCLPTARMVVRFGGINDRTTNPLELIQRSLSGTEWRCITVRSAGNASHGKRQADHFIESGVCPMAEYDLYAKLS